MPELRDYGQRGRIGLGTPQANPTVEAEMRRLIPGDVEYFTLRLTSGSDDPKKRLIAYLEDLPFFLDRFGGLKLDGFMFACTGSSYLIDSGKERQIIAEAEERLGAPVFTAVAAIRRWLNENGSRRIVLLSPYPEWLNAPAASYWREAGFEVADKVRVEIGSDDTYGIYSLSAENAAAALERIAELGADTILVSGTGMPSLPLLRYAAEQGLNMVSSNLALASQALAHLGQEITPVDQWNLGDQ